MKVRLFILLAIAPLLLGQQKKNVIITPHIATRSQDELQRQLSVVKENIARFVNGEPLMYVVDKQKGY